MKDASVRRCSLAAALAFMTLLPISTAFAQKSSAPGPQISTVPAAQSVDLVASLTFAQVSSFQAVFTTLAQQGHVTFVAEDQPLHTTLLPRQVPRFKDGGEPLSQIVAQVAAAYDYDAERHGSVFVLKKRYTDPADLPDVTLAECARSLKEIQEITDAISPHLNSGEIGKNESVANFLTSLTPEQLEMMRDKSRSVPEIDAMTATEEQVGADIKKHYDLAVQSQGLPISTLTPEQRDVVRQMLLVLSVELHTEQLNVQQVTEAAAGDPSFCKRTEDQAHSFGYELPGDGRQKVYTKLTFWGGKSQIVLNGVPLPPLADQTAPFQRVQPTPQAVGVSLAQAVSSLDTRTSFQPKMLVTKELAPKRVSLFGTDNVPASTVLQALADVYGLSIQRREDKSLVLASQDIQIPLDYAAMMESVHKAVLDPLRRAMAQEVVRGKTAEGAQPMRYGSKAPATMRSSALRLLRTAVEPRLRTARDAHVLLSSLGDRENSALALVLTLPQLEYIIGLGEGGVPETYTRFDELCLRGEPSPEDPKKFGLEFFLPVMGGTVPPHEVGAIGNIDYTPNNAVVSRGTP